MSLINERTSAFNSISDEERVLRGASLIWRRDGADWVLFSGRHRFGRVVPDSKYAGVWRSVLSGGRLSDRANLAWAKNAVLMAAERELEWEGRQRAAIVPPNCPEKRGVFKSAASPVAKTVEGVAPNPHTQTPSAERAEWRPTAAFQPTMLGGSP
jgi:hypothetical protein